MFCPECQTEYRPGFTRCSDCDVDLVHQLPKREPDPDVKLVKVFETHNPVLISVIESMFEGESIAFVTRSGDLQELIGGGRLGAAFDTMPAPVQFWVREDQESAARELLEGLEDSEPLAEDAEVEGSDEEDLDEDEQ